MVGVLGLEPRSLAALDFDPACLPITILPITNFKIRIGL